MDFKNQKERDATKWVKGGNVKGKKRFYQYCRATCARFDKDPCKDNKCITNLPRVKRETMFRKIVMHKDEKEGYERG